MTLGIIIAAIICLVFLSAFFSGSETALTASSRARDRRAAVVLALRETPERLLGSLLLGNNLVNILASALGTLAFVQLFGEAGVIYATLVMTAVVLVFGEVTMRLAGESRPVAQATSTYALPPPRG